MLWLVASLLSSRFWLLWSLCVAHRPPRNLQPRLKPILTAVEHQPLAAHAERVSKALELVGAPLNNDQQKQLRAAIENKDATEGIKAIQAVLDPLAIAAVNINPESRVKVAAGTGPPRAGAARLASVPRQGAQRSRRHRRAARHQPQRQLPYRRSTGSPEPKPGIQPHEVRDRWLDVDVFDKQPLAKHLSGLARSSTASSSSTAATPASAKPSSPSTSAKARRTSASATRVDVLFDCRPAVEVKLEVLDDDGKPTTGQFVIRDAQGRVYPSLTRRLAPDFFFHQQIYRHNGETVLLPPGKYDVTYTRGPEYLDARTGSSINATSTVPRDNRLAAPAQTNPSASSAGSSWRSYGWYSGDHHVHAAGCAHYEAPTEGVTPEDMMRHILGEDLNVGCVLSWGPCWYHQKQFFEGKVHELSHAAIPDALRRRSLRLPQPARRASLPAAAEGRRLPEHHAHRGVAELGLCRSSKWGKEQGGVVGFSHSGWGLAIKEHKLPSYEMPPFDGIGANEYIVDRRPRRLRLHLGGRYAHPSGSSTSGITRSTAAITARISGETDFPCIYGERVGLGRGYVKLDKNEPLDFDRWVDGIKRRPQLLSATASAHLIDFTVNGLGVGETGKDGRNSVLAVKAGEPVEVKVRAAAVPWREAPTMRSAAARSEQKPYWHVERARIGDTRTVPVELIVNGQAVERQRDRGRRRHQRPHVRVHAQAIELGRRSASSPRAHTNPIFVEVDGKPIRASRKSAQWCLDAVDVCWNSKERGIREAEREAAARRLRQSPRGLSPNPLGNDNRVEVSGRARLRPSRCNWTFDVGR